MEKWHRSKIDFAHHCHPKVRLGAVGNSAANMACQNETAKQLATLSYVAKLEVVNETMSVKHQRVDQRPIRGS
jgi:hypothetical protein